MRINDLLVESEQIDELSWQDVKKGASNLGKGAKLGFTNPQAALNLSKNKNTGTATKVGRYAGVGANKAADAIARGAKALPGAVSKLPGLGQQALSGLGKAAGYIGGIPQGIGRAAKQGYSSAVTGIGGGEDPLKQAPAQAPTQPPVARSKTRAAAPTTVSSPQSTGGGQGGGGFASGFSAQAGGMPSVPDNQMTPAQQQQSAVTVKQINKAIPTLRTRDLKSVKKNVDTTLANKAPAATGKPNLQVQQGGKATGTTGVPESATKQGKPVVEFYSNFLKQVI